MTKQPAYPQCASCTLDRSERICLTETGRSKKGCPTLTKPAVLSEANAQYDLPQIREFARNASIQEAQCYANRYRRPFVKEPTKTRILEICEFAGKMGYQRLGLAFCVGLIKEARAASAIFENWGFEVVSVLCKAGRTPKELLGLDDADKVVPGTREAMCNPIYQAKRLNSEKVDFNILLGLCVGHDSLFFKYAEAPTTVLAVKDRVTGHNPLAAVYLSDSYYEKLMRPDK
jgi:uncharacterized metal-binding protein